jgi:Domain of unknown function (DUF4157)
MMGRTQSAAAGRDITVGASRAPVAVLQRTCACGRHAGGGECVACRKKHATQQRQSEIYSNGQKVPAMVHEVLSSRGNALDASTRKSMESRLGQDFSGVRVHADPESDRSARAVNAKAYTVGSDVVFAAGQYSPGTLFGAALLAHELTHVRDNHTRLEGNVLRRYESPEHQDLGDASLGELAEYLKTPAGAAWVQKYKLNPQAMAQLPNDPFLGTRKIQVGTLQLTPGDVIALVGDFYRTPQALAGAPPHEVKDLLASMGRERRGELAGGKANAEYQAITLKYRKESESYIELAKENAPHFAPLNREEWKRLHTQAIEKVQQPPERGRTKLDEIDEALLIDAGAGHFLTDAFASGHLFNKRELETAIIVYLRQNPPQGGEIEAYYGLLQSQDAMTDVVLKNIHDRLNAEGVEVTNKKGMKWRTYGDNFLKNAQETRHIAALAVYLSRQQVMQAAKGAPAPDAEEVLELLPDQDSVRIVTAQAIRYIPEAVRTLPALLYRQRLSAGAALKGKIAAGMPNIPGIKPLVTNLVPTLVQSNLETVASPGRQKQLEDLEEQGRKTGMPGVAPSFTVFSFH